MNKILFAVASACMTGLIFADVSVNNVIVRQQWPWSEKVNIDFVLSDPAGGEHDLKVVLKNGATVITPKVGSLSGDLLAVKSGAHRIVWDPTVGAGADDPAVLADFTATVTSEDNGDAYMIIDLTAKDESGKYAVTYTSVVPEGGWNQDVYKTDKIVLRRIPAGQAVLGATPTSPGYNANYNVQHKVTFENAFYIAIFETTCKQYVTVMGGDNPNGGFSRTRPYQDDMHPVALTSYDQLRGTAAATTTQWPNLVEGGFIAALNGKLNLPSGREGYGLDLPTVSQWEYACRAGTTGPAYDTDLAAIANYNTSGLVHVGTLKPNGFGLYDILGNVTERCRDYIYYKYPWWDGSDQVDPLLYNDEAALASSLYTYAAGGHCESSAEQTLCYGFVTASKGNDQEAFCGFRMVFTANR